MRFKLIHTRVMTNVCMYFLLAITASYENKILFTMNLLAKFPLDKLKSGTPLKMNFVIIDCQLVKVYLYDCVCCNGLLMFNLLLSLLIFHCNLSISLCSLCKSLSMSLPSI